MKSLAIIPARSGSKGMKDKNISSLNGKPLMFYTIEAALKSGCFDKIMLSTDSAMYADIAKDCGAEVPFMRTDKLSGDNAGSWDVVREVLGNYAESGMQFDYVALLQPTSPLRNARDIINAFDMLEKANITNVVSVTEVAHPVQWCFKIKENGSMEEMASSPYSYMRRQELEKHYLENGAIYLVNAQKIMDFKYNFYADNCYAYIMPRERSVDIDLDLDLLVAELIFKNTREQKM